MKIRFACPHLNLLQRTYIVSMRKWSTAVVSVAALSLLTYPVLRAVEPNSKAFVESFKVKSRKQHIEDITKDPNYDVVIIGGGCNGAGVLLDAATRGFRCLLIEKDDFGSGASSKSTKLIHGGVRYLQQVFSIRGQSLSSRWEKAKLVKQAIQERSLMIDSAPHLTNKISIVLPSTNPFQTIYYYAGMVMYYLIYAFCHPATGTKFNFPYFLNWGDLKSIFPSISQKYISGIVYQDGSFNDSRLLMAAVMTAANGNQQTMPNTFKPATVLNRAQFTDFIKDSSGRVIGVCFRDTVSQKECQVYAKHVVNCTGAFADKIRLKDDPNAKKRICIVGGSHITYSNKISSNKYGICFPSSDGRILLLVPWQGRVIAGTTEQPFDEPENNPLCNEEERTFIRGGVHETMSELSYEELFDLEVAHWCGLRPLVISNDDKDVHQSHKKNTARETKNISRTHVIEESKSGLLSLMGGKWTIYRLMGEHLVDTICQREVKHGRQFPRSQTKNLKLWGSANSDIKAQLVKSYKEIGMYLYENYGLMALEIAKGDLNPIVGPITKAELEWIVKNEMVTEIEDVLLRRTRSTFLMSKQQTLALIPVIAEIFRKQHKLSHSAYKELIDKTTRNILMYDFD